MSLPNFRVIILIARTDTQISCVINLGRNDPLLSFVLAFLVHNSHIHNGTAPVARSNISSKNLSIEVCIFRTGVYVGIDTFPILVVIIPVPVDIVGIEFLLVLIVVAQSSRPASPAFQWLDNKCLIEITLSVGKVSIIKYIRKIFLNSIETVPYFNLVVDWLERYCRIACTISVFGYCKMTIQINIRQRFSVLVVIFAIQSVVGVEILIVYKVHSRSPLQCCKAEITASLLEHFRQLDGLLGIAVKEIVFDNTDNIRGKGT